MVTPHAPPNKSSQVSRDCAPLDIKDGIKLETLYSQSVKHSPSQVV